MRAIRAPRTRVDYLDRAGAGARAREYLGVAKTASDYAGRLIALVVMARYAKEEAVAQSNRSFSALGVGRSLPWSAEVLDLVDELAAERLSEHLTAAVREQRADERTQEAEQAQRRASIDERSARLDELDAMSASSCSRKRARCSGPGVRSSSSCAGAARPRPPTSSRRARRSTPSRRAATAGCHRT